VEEVVAPAAPARAVPPPIPAAVAAASYKMTAPPPHVGSSVSLSGS
jgi:hypothetical protein